MRHDDRLITGKQFADTATDLTDDEIKKVMEVVNLARQKHSGKANTSENLDHLRDEILTRLAEINVLAELDPSPCFFGEPPLLEIVGKISSDPIHKYGFDHEKKQHQVLKSKERKEDYLGQKEPTNARKPKKK